MKYILLMTFSCFILASILNFIMALKSGSFLGGVFHLMISALLLAAGTNAILKLCGVL